jgi:hypothetical protein
MKIIILHSQTEIEKNIIKKYFQGSDGRSFAYLCLDKKMQNFCDSIKNTKATKVKLPTLSNYEHKNILKDYVNLVGEISFVNSKSKIWWASDISSKNRLLSPLLSTLENINFIINSIKFCRDNSKNLFIIDIDSPISIFLTEYAKKEKIILQKNSEYFLKFSYRYRAMLSKWLHLVRSIASSFLAIFYTRLSFGSISRIDKSIPIYLIKSHVFPSALISNNAYYDPFFGRLSDYLMNEIPENSQVVTLSQGFSNRYKLYKKMRGLSNSIVVPVESFICINDIFLAGVSIARSWIFSPIRVPNNILFLNYNLSNTVRELVSITGGSIPFSDYLYYYAALRMARRYQIKVCYLTYEGNHWERMFIMGLKEICPTIEVIGYQHSTIPQSAAGVFISEREVSIIPHPDRVITTGIKATQILSENSFFPQEKIQTGCALRYQYLYKLDYKVTKQIGEKYTLLVALESAIEASKLFLYAIRQAESFNHISFIVRAHPAFPIDDMFDIIGVKFDNLPHNMEVSESIHVVDDIERSDAVLYWGSTVSLEALMMGKPVISFDMGNMLSFDPLSLLNFSGLKWIINEYTSMHDIINKILCMDDDKFLSKANIGRKEIEKYFSQRTIDNMQVFLPK